MMKLNNDQIGTSNLLAIITNLSRERMLLWLALIIAMGLALWVQWPRLTNPNSIQDDFRGYYWFNRLQEPDLYPDDTFPSHDSDHQFLGIDGGLLFDSLNNLRAGYHLLYFLFSPLISPILFNKVLIFPLILAVAYYAFRIGQALKGNWTGFALAIALVVFNLAAEDTISVASGVSRSFAFPLLLALVYYLMTQRYIAAGIVVAISGITYAPVFVLSLATYILAVLEPIKAGSIRFRFRWQLLASLVVLGAISIIMIPKFVSIIFYLGPRLAGNSEAWGLLGNPTYQLGGRYPLLLEFPFVGLGGVFTRIGPFWQAMVLFVLALGTWLLVPRLERIFPKTLKHLLIAAVVCFAFAWATIILASTLTLYYPSRYMRATLPIVFLIFIVTNLEEALVSARSRFENLTATLRTTFIFILATWTVSAIFLLKVDQNLIPFLNTNLNQRVEWLLVFASAFLIGALLLFIFGSIQVSKAPKKTSGSHRQVTHLILGLLAIAGALYTIGPNPQHNYLPLSPSQMAYLNFVQTLPKDVKLASGSCVLENIPLVAKRQVLWDCEDKPKEEMVIDTLRAYYASSLDEVLNFCHLYDVDYFVIDKNSFKKGRLQSGKYFIEPFNSILHDEGISQAGHVLADAPDNMQVYDNEDVIVMRCELDNSNALTNQTALVDGLSILAYDEVSGNLTQADGSETTIKWLAEKEKLPDYDICFSIKDSVGEIRQKGCEPLSPEFPTSQWSIPTIRYESYNFRISPYLNSGDYSIVASVTSGEENDNDNGIEIGEISYTTFHRSFSPTKTDTELDYDVIWGDVIALADFGVSKSHSNTLDVDILWHTLNRMDESYKVFAHVKEVSTGEIASQIDTIPRNWTYRTDWWEKHELISDRLSIPISDLGSGRFEVWLGFYNEESGERLPLQDLKPLTFSTDEDAVKIYTFNR